MFYQRLFQIQLLQENFHVREPNQPALLIIDLVKSSKQNWSMIKDQAFLCDNRWANWSLNNKIIGSSYQILLYLIENCDQTLESGSSAKRKSLRSVCSIEKWNWEAQVVTHKHVWIFCRHNKCNVWMQQFYI